MISANGAPAGYLCLYWIVYDLIGSTLPEFHDSFTDSAVTSDVPRPVGGLGKAGVRIEHDKS